jgi:hypothetical protein
MVVNLSIQSIAPRGANQHVKAFPGVHLFFSLRNPLFDMSTFGTFRFIPLGI